jgi:hypothetical protein
VGILHSSPRREPRLGLAVFIAVFRREQTPACAVVSLHVGVGVILTAKAPNRRRALRPFGRRDDPGPRSRNTGERKWTRPHCSSSSSWCCCSAAADSSTDAGFESDGRFRSPGLFVPLRTSTAPTGCRRSWRDRRFVTSRVYDRHIVARPIRGAHSRSSREIATPRERGTHTPVAPTQIDARAPLALGPPRHSSTNGRALWMTRRRH